MLANLVNLSFLALALPITSLANHVPLVNRHHDLAKRADGHVEVYKRFDNVKWSWYYTETGNQGSCGTFLKDNQYTVAVNPMQMNPSLCFKPITLRRKGKAVTATIVDTCPTCPYGGLDLSPSLFREFGDPIQDGIFWDGSWDFGNPPPPPPPPPKPSSITTPPPSSPTPKPPISTTSNSTSVSTNISSSSVNYHSGVASGLAVPTGTVDRATGQGNNLADLYQVFVQLGSIAVAGHQV